MTFNHAFRDRTPDGPPFKKKMKLSDFKLNEETNLYICPECGKEFSKYGIKSHFWRNHTEEGRKFDPNTGYIKGTRVAWNKGLTKETDERVRKYGLTTSERYRNHINTPPSLGKTQSEETKKKISDSRKKYLLEHPEKVPYKLNHSSKQSFPEKFFETVFINNELVFEKEFYANGYWLDFCFNKTFYVEIDGDQHYLDKRIVEHDKIRTEKLSELGFNCIERVRWSEFQKLDKENQKEYITKLVNKIKTVF